MLILKTLFQILKFLIKRPILFVILSFIVYWPLPPPVKSFEFVQMEKMSVSLNLIFGALVFVIFFWIISEIITDVHIEGIKRQALISPTSATLNMQSQNNIYKVEQVAPERINSGDLEWVVLKMLGLEIPSTWTQSADFGDKIFEEINRRYVMAKANKNFDNQSLINLLLMAHKFSLHSPEIRNKRHDNLINGLVQKNNQYLAGFIATKIRSVFPFENLTAEAIEQSISEVKTKIKNSEKYSDKKEEVVYGKLYIPNFY